MTRERDPNGNWTGEEWVGDQSPGSVAERPVTDPGEPVPEPGAHDQWNKTEWVGDQGEGMPAPRDPGTMPEGSTSISGQRHSPESAHWAPPDQTRRADEDALKGDRPLDEAG